MYFNIYWQE